MLRSSAVAASRVALKLIGASSRPLIFHPTRAIVSTPIKSIPIRQFLVSDPISQFFMMDQSRGYSSSRRAAASSSEDDENENENDDVDEEFDSDDVVEFDSGDEYNSEVECSDSD